MDCTTIESRLRTGCKSGISKLSADIQTSDIQTDRQAKKRSGRIRLLRDINLDPNDKIGYNDKIIHSLFDVTRALQTPVSPYIPALMRFILFFFIFVL